MNHYTTIKRKADLAVQLGLTERQVSRVDHWKSYELLRGTIVQRKHLFADKDLVSKPTGEGEEAVEKAARAIKRAADESARSCGGGRGGYNGGGGGWRNDGLCHRRNGDGWDAGRSDADQREHLLRTATSNADDVAAHVDVYTHVAHISTHVSVHIAAYISAGVATHDIAYAIPGSL